ncbi:MAG: glutamine--fructose-6-phosphate transaminase (isomerizing) [Candidatus Doudnabacteria bacterium]|nr:glutamine--fructose-6-phosphate transaminase (isomerizing) [Candidatus Doudnabacteria bacterium]
MCGIIGYIGRQKAPQILIEGLKRLEYRGYDSAGLAVVDNNNRENKINCVKVVGKVKGLEPLVSEQVLNGSLGIAHTRWATHGAPTEINAHPHCDCKKRIYVAHNGIIENYAALKSKLEQEGHKFQSETDTEVLPHLIEKFFRDCSLEEAVARALTLVEGTYGIAVICEHEPRKLVAARCGSPLVLGLGNKEYIIASDVSAILRHTRQVIYLDDGEMAILTSDDFNVVDVESAMRGETTKQIYKQIQEIEWDIKQAQKEGYPHFMLKEINEQDEVVRNALRGRLLMEEGTAKLGGLENVEDKLRGIKRMVIAACGTAYYAGLIAEYMFSEFAGLLTKTEIASEFRYRHPILDEQTALLNISQSGETADTLAALREAKRKGILSLGIVNVVGSTIARETDAGVYNHAGPEIGVASTKAFISQLTVLSLLTLFLGRQRNMPATEGKNLAEELNLIPEKIAQILKQQKYIKKIAQQYAGYEHALYLGRKYNYPVALEGALKLKEISYIHAEGYAAGEMKHGPIALVDKNLFSVFIAPYDTVYEKIISNMQEIKARGGKIIAIATEGNKDIKKIADDVIYIPPAPEMLSPLLTTVPLQLFAYYAAAERGCPIDQPRNLAKSVTVE